MERNLRGLVGSGALVAPALHLASDLTLMDPISHKYTGKPFPFRNPEGRVALVIEVEKARYAKLPFEHTPSKRG
jgi:hypothetical protein